MRVAGEDGLLEEDGFATGAVAQAGWEKRFTAKAPVQAVAGQSATCEPEWVGAEHPLFLLYTSGSTGKPKGVQHSTGGYLLHAALTTKWTFDLKADDVFWCTADIGWVTGHTYITYGPLALGGTEIVFEGVPTYPDAGRFWKMIQDHKVTIFYTAPTAIRSLIKAAEGTAENRSPGRAATGCWVPLRADVPGERRDGGGVAVAVYHRIGGVDVEV